MICIPIISTTTKEALNDIKCSVKVADIIELRLDYIKDLDLEKLFSIKEKPYIITLRSKEQGGNFNNSDDEKLALLQKAVDLCADYIDVEYNFP